MHLSGNQVGEKPRLSRIVCSTTISQARLVDALQPQNIKIIAFRQLARNQDFLSLLGRALGTAWNDRQDRACVRYAGCDIQSNLFHKILGDKIIRCLLKVKPWIGSSNTLPPNADQDWRRIRHQLSSLIPAVVVRANDPILLLEEDRSLVKEISAVRELSPLVLWDNFRARLGIPDEDHPVAAGRTKAVDSSSLGCFWLRCPLYEIAVKEDIQFLQCMGCHKVRLYSRSLPWLCFTHFVRMQLKAQYCSLGCRKRCAGSSGLPQFSRSLMPRRIGIGTKATIGSTVCKETPRLTDAFEKYYFGNCEASTLICYKYDEIYKSTLCSDVRGPT